MIRYIFAIIYIITIGIFDKTTRKIPNYLILIGFISSAVFNYLIYPISVRDHIARWVVFVIIFLFGMKRWLGGGDIKMWMALTFLIGPMYSCISVLIASLLLIAYALITDFKSNFKTAFISVTEVMNNKSLRNITITSTKAYPLGVFMIAPVTILCVMSLMGAGFDVIR